MRIDIVEVARNFLTLNPTRDGKFSCKCPFHSDRNPSMFFFPDSGRFYCFGCKESGDAFTFLQRINNWGWSQARDYLVSLHPEAFNEQEESLLEDVTKTWREELLSSSFRINLAARLGFSPEVCERYGIGYASPEVNRKLVSRYGAERLRKVGLISPERGASLMFRDRITLPLRNRYGRVIGFQGRGTGSETCKYLTVYNSVLFDRNSYVYGEEHLVEEREIVLVEGLKDFYTLEGYGFNVVCCLGTNLGEEQLSKLKNFLKRYGSRLIIMFDGDEAGIVSANKLAQRLEDPFKKVSIARLPPSTDPADLTQQEVERNLYLAENSFREIRRHRWSLEPKGVPKMVIGSLLPGYMADYLRGERRGDQLKVPSQEQLMLVRVYAATLRLEDWIRGGVRGGTSLETVLRMKDYLFKYRVFLSAKGGNYEHYRP